MRIIKSLYENIVKFVNSDGFKVFIKLFKFIITAAAVVTYVVCSIALGYGKRSKR